MQMRSEIKMQLQESLENFEQSPENWNQDRSCTFFSKEFVYFSAKCHPSSSRNLELMHF